jgi:predicted O-methyltransferase YrrM
MSLDNHTAALAVLEDLHAEAAQDSARWIDRNGSANATANARGDGALVRLGEFFLAVSPEEGRLLYVLARTIKARRIVEFGASYGISSLYLAAAAKDNAGGLTTTEVHPDKCASLRKTFQKAGLAGTITLLEGDAHKTLRDVGGPIDMLFLDGWKGAYLPIFQLLHTRLSPGALVLADNASHPAAADYLHTVQSPHADCETAILGNLAITWMGT